MTQDNRKVAAISTFAKVAVHCSSDTFVVNQTLVHSISNCVENIHLGYVEKVSGLYKATDN